MKPLLSCLTLLLIGFASSSLYAQSFHPELSKEEPKKNKIKSISEDSQSPCDLDRSNAAQLSRGGWATKGSSYDARGNQTSDSHYSTWEGRGYKNYFNYDDKDNLVEEGAPGLKRHVEHIDAAHLSIAVPSAAAQAPYSRKKSHSRPPGSSIAFSRIRLCRDSIHSILPSTSRSGLDADTFEL
jgi:hypothetical protein